jgi:ribonuclease HI
MSLHSQLKLSDQDETIYLNFDGLCEPRNPGGIATYGVIIRKGKVHLLEDNGLAISEPWSHEASNNVAEYSALIRGLEWLKNHKMLDSKVVVRGDSSLVINQLRGTFKVKAIRIVELFKRAKELLNEFKDLRIEWVDRSQNKEADLLSRIAYARFKKKYPPPPKKVG